jgi:hypothetical protein
MRDPQRTPMTAMLAHDDMRADRRRKLVEHRGPIHGIWPRLGLQQFNSVPLLPVVAVEAELGALGLGRDIKHRRPRAEPFGGVLARALVVQQRKPREPLELGVVGGGTACPVVTPLLGLRAARSWARPR